MSDEKEPVSKVSQDMLDDVGAAYDEVYDYYKQFAEESDRGAAVLAAALFEDRLQEFIETRFVNCDKKVRRLFFSFKAKVDLAYALGLCDRKTRDNLYVVKEIRNKFAHSPEPMGFDHEKVVARCRKLDADIQDPDNLRARYLTYLREVELSLRHSYVPGLPVPVERRDDPVECPNCGGNTIKQSFPSRPVPDNPENAENVTDALGQVFCKSCYDTYPWGYSS